jgi:Polyketide cyclase / dehydrase and lipid transport
MKQRNHHFNYTVAINNTVDKVWQILVDVALWHKWDTELKEANLEGDFVLNAKGTFIPKKGPKLKFYISEIISNKSYTFNTKMPIGELVIKRTLTAENEVVYFTDDIAFTGFLKFVFGIMLGGQFRKVLPEVMDNFKKLAEKNI